MQRPFRVSSGNPSGGFTSSHADGRRHVNLHECIASYTFKKIVFIIGNLSILQDFWEHKTMIVMKIPVLYNSCILWS